MIISRFIQVLFFFCNFFLSIYSHEYARLRSLSSLSPSIRGNLIFDEILKFHYQIHSRNITETLVHTSFSVSAFRFSFCRVRVLQFKVYPIKLFIKLEEPTYLVHDVHCTITNLPSSIDKLLGF